MCTEKSYGGANIEAGKKIIGSNVSLYKDKSRNNVESESEMNKEPYFSFLVKNFDSCMHDHSFVVENINLCGKELK